MKKFMLAVAVLAVASMSLVSCGKKDPKAAAEALANEVKEYAQKPDTDPEKVMAKAKEFEEKAQAILKDCKTAEDSAAVEKIFSSVDF